MVCNSLKGNGNIVSPFPCAKIMLIPNTGKHLTEKYGSICTFYKIVCGIYPQPLIFIP